MGSAPRAADAATLRDVPTPELIADRAPGRARGVWTLRRRGLWP